MSGLAQKNCTLLLRDLTPVGSQAGVPFETSEAAYRDRTIILGSWRFARRQGDKWKQQSSKLHDGLLRVVPEVINLPEWGGEAPCAFSFPGMAVIAQARNIVTESAAADQVASGRWNGGGAVPGRYGAATVIGRPEAGRAWTGTVEPAAGPAESCPAAAGRPCHPMEDRSDGHS